LVEGYKRVWVLVLEAHVYTSEEFITLVRWCRLTAYEALTSDIVLYRDPEYYERVLSEFRKAVEKLKPRLRDGFLVRSIW